VYFDLLYEGELAAVLASKKIILMNFRCRRWNSKWVLLTEVLLC